MREITVRNLPKETIYRDVVVIGNGPSGISLSYMLSGNWPYWNTEKLKKHPDELLRARLNYADSNKSLVEQDLEILSEGLEGRSTNPISLLIDSLEHPGADIGLELPSILEYKNKRNREIDHIVIGKGPPGGTWHRMDPKLRTLSLATWMSLPGLSFTEWEEQQHQDVQLMGDVQSILDNALKENYNCSGCTRLKRQQSQILCQMRKPFVKDFSQYFTIRSKGDVLDDENLNNNNNESEIGALCCKCTKDLKRNCPAGDLLKFNDDDNMSQLQQQQQQQQPPRRNLSLKRLISKEVQSRALVSRVAKYYEDYVRIMNLNKNFKNDAVVTLIAPLLNDICNETVSDNCNYIIDEKIRNAKWIVTGITKTTGQPFYYACKNIVLANGSSDLANRLGLRGEDMKKSWVKHELPELENDLEKYSDKDLKALKPVVIVGAGLSAADAVTICRLSNIPVIHVFRSRTAGLDKSLPENVYPEYHEVHRMMKEPKNVYDYYTPLPEHTISGLSTNDSNGNHRVTVKHLISGETRTLNVSYCAILIGSRPDLRFTSGLMKCPMKGISIGNIFNNTTIDQQQQQQSISSTLSRKISWFKNICAKCKHLNICDRSRRHNEFRKISGHQFAKTCECHNNGKLFLCDNKENNICMAEDSGIGLGLDPLKAIDSKTNQIAVDKITYEIQRTNNKGLYAMGPLVGDNFVRFIPGGALAITAALNREND